jgi:hypothetical protein
MTSVEEADANLPIDLDTAPLYPGVDGWNT